MWMKYIYMYAHTHADYRWSYMKARLRPLGFVGGTVFPFLIPGNTEQCRGNGFLVLASSAQIQAVTAAVVCLGKSEKGLHQINRVTLGQLCFSHNVGKRSQKPPGGENPFTLYTHIVTQRSKGLGLENENHCDSTMQGGRSVFFSSSFRVGKTGKQSYILTWPSL